MTRMNLALVFDHFSEERRCKAIGPILNCPSTQKAVLDVVGKVSYLGRQ